MGQSCDFLHSWHRPGPSVDAEIPTHHGSGTGQSVGRRQDRELLQVPRKQEWSAKKAPKNKCDLTDTATVVVIRHTVSTVHSSAAAKDSGSSDCGRRRRR